MGKTGKWFKSIWSGKKQSTKKPTTNSPLPNTDQNPTNPVAVVRPPTPTKDRKRWSFRRSSAASIAGNPSEPSSVVKEVDEKIAETVAEAVIVVEDNVPVEEASAIKIQSVFRSFLAKKALKALRGLVKLQALVRGHLVRKQATATLRCMEALVTAQARARARRIRAVEEAKIMMINNHRHSTPRRSTQQEKVKHLNYHDIEENIKIVEMDHAEYKLNVKNRIISSRQQPRVIEGRIDDKISTYQALNPYDQQFSPAPSATTDLSPRTCSGYFDDYNFAMAQTSPYCYSSTPRPNPSAQAHLFSFPRPDYNYTDTMTLYDYPLHPNYMSNTESSRAKARSQSAPKQRPEYERQPSRGRRPSIEGRGIPKGARMQRSSSHVGSTAGQAVQYPWSIKLDKSIVSLVDSECGSNTTNGNNYSKSVVSSYDPRY